MRLQVLLAGLMLVLLSFTGSVPGSIKGTEVGDPLSDDIMLEGIIGEEGKNTTFENETIRLHGSWINVYGNVTFRNVTLYLNTSLQIQNQGVLRITDYDNDPNTLEDRSRIIGNESIVAPTLFNFERTDHTIIENSQMDSIHFIQQFNDPGWTRISNCTSNNTLVRGYPYSIQDSLFSYSAVDVQDSVVFDSKLTDSILAVQSSVLTDISIINSRIRVLESSILENIDMVGSSTGGITGIEFNGDFFGYLKNSTIRGYHQAVSHTQGDLEMDNCSISNSETGIYSENGENLYLLDTIISNCTSPINNNGLVSMKDSRVQGGSIERSNHAFIAIRSEFIDMGEVSGIMSGAILNSTFENMEVALNGPRSSTIRGNLFRNCDVVISEPESCLIYHNSFIDNLDIDDGSPSTGWYNSELEEGNFYSSYDGSDDGSNDRVPNDGIGDTGVPYLGRDLFPFMKDLAWNMPEIPEPALYHQLGTGLVNIYWTSEENIGSFVQRSSNPSFTSDLKTWSIKENNISIDNNPNSTQYFRIAVYNLIGFRGWSSPKGLTIDQVPLPPVNVQVETIDSGSSLKVSWDHVGEDIERTLIFFASRNNTPSTREVFYPMNEIVLEGLDNRIEYSIFLLTEDSSGQISDPTENVTGIPVDILPPPPPRNLRTDVVSNISIELYWNPPSIQDISGYQIFRLGPDDDTLKFIREVSKLAPKYIDTGLEDNTTYVYGMRSIDDDGPLSVMSELIEVTTFHYNRAPVFNGSYQFISLMEDQAGIEIPIDNISNDPDGDQVLIKIDETYRVDAEISGNLLLVEPEKDEAGIGFIRFQATDGEITTIFTMDVLIEEVSDPPTNVRILFPVNGSVFLPGSPVMLRGEAEDADTVHGDLLTYRWISSKDGYLNGDGSSLDYANVILSPGSHVITMEVFDSNRTVVSRNVTVMVSLWGWSGIPWSVIILEGKAHEQGGKFTVRIENDSPIFLMFSIEPGGEMDPDIFGERGLIVSASSRGDIDIPFKLDSNKENEITITLMIRAESPNGTFAGTSSIEFDLKVEDIEEDEEPPYLMIALIVISALIALVGVVLFLALRRSGYRMKVNEKIEMDDANQEDGAKDGKG